LDKYDRAKEYSSSRPVQTEHGNVGEAAVREWLRTFLPLRYGVTSGFIIPGIVVKEYVLLHYDVIIYDKINSPILWIDDNPDLAGQGQKQAIPAEHVHAVFEVKATFTRKHAIDALAKLSQLNMLRGWLPSRFVSLVLFFELDVALANKRYILKHLIPDSPVLGYRGGAVLRCKVNPHTTGYFELAQHSENDKKYDPDAPLVRDVETLPIYAKPDGSVTIEGEVTRSAAPATIAPPRRMMLSTAL
jgi:hypothetical protein